MCLCLRVSYSSEEKNHVLSFVARQMSANANTLSLSLHGRQKKPLITYTTLKSVLAKLTLNLTAFSPSFSLSIFYLSHCVNNFSHFPVTCMRRGDTARCHLKYLGTSSPTDRKTESFQPLISQIFPLEQTFNKTWNATRLNLYFMSFKFFWTTMYHIYLVSQINRPFFLRSL